MVIEFWCFCHERLGKSHGKSSKKRCTNPVTKYLKLYFHIMHITYCYEGKKGKNEKHGINENCILYKRKQSIKRSIKHFLFFFSNFTLLICKVEMLST